MGNTNSPPPFSLFMQLPCLWLPTATHEKKKSAPRERVSIATAFTRATPQSIHLSYTLQRFHRQNNLRVCVFWLERRYGGFREEENKPEREHRCPTADRPDGAAWEDAHAAALHPDSLFLFRAIKMTESLHAKPRWLSGRAAPCSNSWHTENRKQGPASLQELTSTLARCTRSSLWHNKRPDRQCCAQAQNV